MGINLDEGEALSTVILCETVDISSASELKALLVKALGSGKEVRVSLEGAAYLDATAIQLIWAAEREARSGGVGFALAGPVPERISAALLDAGFDRFPAAECAR
jgi:anti-anti-sigma regulatory factor